LRTTDMAYMNQVRRDDARRTLAEGVGRGGLVGGKTITLDHTPTERESRRGQWRITSP